MARKAKDETGDGHGVSAIRGNGFDPDMASAFVDRMLNLHGDLDSERSTYMLACKDIRGDMKEVLQEAKDAGIPKKALKGVVSKRLLERKIENIRVELEGEDQDAYDNLDQALGGFRDTALGAAALAKADSVGARA